MPLATKPMSRAAKRPLSAPPEVGIGMLLREANIAFNRVLRAHLAVFDITFGEFQHLRHLWEQDGLSQVELAGCIGIPKAASTSVLNSLERRALIRRRRDTTDQRRALVYLTPNGAALREDLWACAKAANATAREGLSNEEVATMFDLVGRVCGNLRRAELQRRRAPEDRED
jgi:DNA-binding MarR family transcriptional regulator